MNSRTTKRFWENYRRLPDPIKRRAKFAYRQLMHDPNYPSLQFKRLRTAAPHYSVRVTLNYRAVGLLDGDTIIWDMIGNHDEYDAYIKSLS